MIYLTPKEKAENERQSKAHLDKLAMEQADKYLRTDLEEITLQVIGALYLQRLGIEG